MIFMTNEKLTLTSARGRIVAADRKHDTITVQFESDDQIEVCGIEIGECVIVAMQARREE